MLKKCIPVLLIITLILTACSPVSSEELIAVSTSPSGTYTVEAYLVNGGATVDWAVKAYLINDPDMKIIFNQYHQSKAEINWINDDIISINGISLDLSKGETYDWRK